MRSRRWSIIPWIRPNAKRRSTQSTIRNVRIVQTIRPGTTSMSDPSSSSAVVVVSWAKRNAWMSVSLIG